MSSGGNATSTRQVPLALCQFLVRRVRVDDRRERRCMPREPLRTSAETTETVVVESKGNIVDTGSTKTSTSYSAEFIEGLPIIGHNYQDILTLAPGVTDTDGDGNPNVHGSRDTGLQYRLDGGNITDPVSGTFGANLNSEIIDE